MQVITTNKNISTKEFLDHVVEEIKNNILDTYDDRKPSDLEVIQVWYCKTIQNHKGLFIVNDLITNKLYPYFYECTYNGDLGEMYIDCYQKTFKHTIRI